MEERVKKIEEKIVEDKRKKYEDTESEEGSDWEKG